jgi:LysR family transcriptional activator of nhaA
VRGEFEDSALLKVFGQAGVGLFVAPSVIGPEVRSQYGARLVGRLAGVKEQFYAISAERRIKHPGVVVLTSGARERLAK